MGRFKLERVSMPATRQTPESKSVSLSQSFDYHHGFGLYSFNVDAGWCGASHASLGRQESSLWAALSGDSLSNYQALSDALFLDTETTGLGYGAGTFAFLVGIAYRTEAGWVGEQLFVSEPSEERAMLQYLKHRIEEASALVSYNGKSFDLPLLRCRYLLHGLQINEPRIHVDLYQMSRSVLKDRLDRKRLVDLEWALFEQQRENDIEGAAIPDAYFCFLHRRSAGELSRVLTHNELDVVTMPQILQWLVDGVSTTFIEVQDELCFLERCAVKGISVELLPRIERLQSRAQGEVAHRLAFLHYSLVRRQDIGNAIGVLQHFYGKTRGALRGKMARRLAIHFEHDLKDFKQALDYAQETEAEEGFDAHRRRIQRLRRKLSRLVDVQ